MNKKIRKRLDSLGKIAQWTLVVGVLGPMAYLGSIFGASMVTDQFSEKINTKSRLEQVVKEEVKNLGGSDKNIELRFTTPDDGDIWKEDTSASYKNFNGGYTIAFKKGHTRQAVRHELYHILDNHIDEGYEMTANMAAETHTTLRYKLAFKQLFVDETTATIYSFTGIKF